MTQITSFPYAVDFNAPNAVINGAGSVSIESGIGVDGSVGLRIIPPLNGQDRAGYSQHDFPATKQLHVRQVIKAVTPLPSCKWMLARRFIDPTHMDETTDVEGCGRFVIQTNPYIGGRWVPYPSQGVCSYQRDATDQFHVADLCAFDWRNHIGQHVSLEYVGDLDAGTYSVYVSTEDGAYNNALFMQINLATGMPFNTQNDPNLIEAVPSDSWFGSIDPMFWNDPAPVGTECILSGMVISDAWIGSPFAVPVPAPEPTPAPTPEPTPAPLPVLVVTFSGGILSATLEGVDFPCVARVTFE